MRGIVTSPIVDVPKVIASIALQGTFAESDSAADKLVIRLPTFSVPTTIAGLAELARAERDTRLQTNIVTNITTYRQTWPEVNTARLDV